MLPLHEDMCALFARIDRLQREPAIGGGLDGAQRAELVLATIESMIGVARANRDRRDALDAVNVATLAEMDERLS
jgi:hypothetical protein